MYKMQPPKIKKLNINFNPLIPVVGKKSGNAQFIGTSKDFDSICTENSEETVLHETTKHHSFIFYKLVEWDSVERNRKLPKELKISSKHFK